MLFGIVEYNHAMDRKAGKEPKRLRGTRVLRPQFALFLSLCGFALMFTTIQNSVETPVETSDVFVYPEFEYGQGSVGIRVAPQMDEIVHV